MKSIGEKLKQLENLIDTKDIGPWDNGFLVHVVKVVGDRGTTVLTTNQVKCIERMHGEHFAETSRDER